MTSCHCGLSYPLIFLFKAHCLLYSDGSFHKKRVTKMESQLIYKPSAPEKLRLTQATLLKLPDYSVNYYDKGSSSPLSTSTAQSDYETADTPGGFTCTVCFSQFSTHSGLNKHIGKIHRRSSKNEECSICLKLFMHKYALGYHVKTVHEHSSRVRCPQCHKLMNNKYSLKRHLEVCVLSEPFC